MIWEGALTCKAKKLTWQ